jgi:hypothetical protein
MESFKGIADLRRSFAVPAGLGSGRPRPVELTGGGRVLAAVAVLMFAAAVTAFIALSVQAKRDGARRRLLAEQGVVTVGEVTRLRPRGDNDWRQIGYRFVADGRVFERDINVSSARRRTLDVGSAVSVRYVPADPRLNDLGIARSGIPAWLPFVIAVPLFFAGVVCLTAIQRQQALLSEGRAAPAVVTAHKKVHSDHGTHQSITYQYPLLSGAVVSGKSQTSRKPPAIGSVICIVYDPDEPTRSMLYPSSLVRPARG